MSWAEAVTAEATEGPLAGEGEMAMEVVSAAARAGVLAGVSEAVRAEAREEALAEARVAALALERGATWEGLTGVAGKAGWKAAETSGAETAAAGKAVALPADLLEAAPTAVEG